MERRFRRGTRPRKKCTGEIFFFSLPLFPLINHWQLKCFKEKTLNPGMWINWLEHLSHHPWTSNTSGVASHILQLVVTNNIYVTESDLWLLPTLYVNNRFRHSVHTTTNLRNKGLHNPRSTFVRVGTSHRLAGIEIQVPNVHMFAMLQPSSRGLIPFHPEATFCHCGFFEQHSLQGM